MLRDITIGQYYPVNSILHRLDPRVKFIGTFMFLISLFVANDFWGYALATVFLVAIVA
ncbi:ABC transporter permease, partial [gut metagenome]